MARKAKQRRRGKRGNVPLRKMGENFMRREVFQAMQTVAQRNWGVIKISEVKEVLNRRGWIIGYKTLSEIVKDEIKGTGWRLYSEERKRRVR